MAVPENSHRDVLLMPVKRMSDRVDRQGQGWQGSTWPPAAGAAVKQPGVTEVVLKGATQGLDRRRHEVVLLTDQAGHQTIRMRFSYSDSARNEGLTRSAGQGLGGAGAMRGERQDRTGQADSSEAAKTPERKGRKE